ncbi:MAG: hypothetical protein WAM62_15270 [Pseudolabrys sp.]
MRGILIASLIAALTAAVALPVQAQSDDERYNIMTPELSVPPKYKSPRGSTVHVVIPRPSSVPQPQSTVPPPLLVPQTGQLLPNMPTLAPSGPGGTETSQDRAMRCANQAGIYGAAAGDRNAYVGSCINQ